MTTIKFDYNHDITIDHRRVYDELTKYNKGKLQMAVKEQPSQHPLHRGDLVILQRYESTVDHQWQEQNNKYAGMEMEVMDHDFHRGTTCLRDPKLLMRNQVWWPTTALRLSLKSNPDEDERLVNKGDTPTTRRENGCYDCISADNPKLQYRCEKCDNDYSNWIDKNGDTCSACKFEPVSGSDFPCVKCKDDSEFELNDSDNQRSEAIENAKGETNMTTKIIETAKRTVDEAIQAGSEGIKQGTANSAATTIVKVTRNYFGESYPKVMDTELGKKAEPLALALFIHFAVGMMGDKVPNRAAIEKNCNRVITAQMSHNSEEFIEKINPFLTMLSEHIDEIPE